MKIHITCRNCSCDMHRYWQEYGNKLRCMFGCYVLGPWQVKDRQGTAPVLDKVNKNIIFFYFFTQIVNEIFSNRYLLQ
jgi:hypothetical protein